MVSLQARSERRPRILSSCQRSIIAAIEHIRGTYNSVGGLGRTTGEAINIRYLCSMPPVHDELDLANGFLLLRLPDLDGKGTVQPGRLGGQMTASSVPHDTIRVSSVAQGSLGSLLSGTNVQSGAITLARASAANYLAKPVVRPLQTDLRIGNLLPTRSIDVVTAERTETGKGARPVGGRAILGGSRRPSRTPRVPAVALTECEFRFPIREVR